MQTQLAAHFPVSRAQNQLSYMFQRGMTYLADGRWTEAEQEFSAIIAQKSSYRQNGRSAKEMLKLAQNERNARWALQQGDLQRALSCFREAGNLERTVFVEDLIQIEDFEQRAKVYFENGRFRQSAWIYDQLLRNYGDDSRIGLWKDAQTACWYEELVPIFDAGLLAFESKAWREAKKQFSEVICGDPEFRRHGQSAVVLLDQCKQEIRKEANEALDNGRLKEALNGYQEIMDMRKIGQVEELMHLQAQGEEVAKAYCDDEKWAKAAAVYEWLTTLTMGSEKQQTWQDLAVKCREKARLTYLFDKGLQAVEQKDWAEAEKRFGAAKEIDPKFQYKGHRTLRWYRISAVKQRLATLFPQ
ncbi:MAG: hypothetical protein KC419_05440 [Anaerolineales bacterium]|nr:hypothetical protein [Anaerolineales bacterium]MCA9927894.1 hypothetical protein [Anaerolineales bacterium]